ncbi:hypothetical protein [Sediminibacterium sp.]|uniref:hypothetical protein n=1 Tax=Sediminibacterium sp. TaxID=1917865 RepID=UPI002732DDC7|nr:hypothetical protein [Sediminibacterium sp.]MDP3394470.1 hypothetical protein [Sediminibacterium sp.]MDP3568305.1 hypothetical protein [Sediminibacterium sp.]
MKKLLISSLMATLFLLACKHEFLNSAINPTPVVVQGGVTGGDTTVSDTVCFQNDVLPLYVSYCASAGCHNANTRADGVQTTDYTTIMKGIKPRDAANSKYYKEITKGEMPPRGYPALSTAQISLIKKWIDQGALNTNCVNSCDTTKFTYSTSVQTILSNNCNGCHGVAPGSGNVYLGTLAATQSYINANKQLFLDAINHAPSLPAAQRMPIGNPMDACKIKQMTKWINAGMPQ